MFVSIWLGVVLAGGQAGGPTVKRYGPEVVETRRAIVAPVVPGIGPTPGAVPRNPDFFQVPQVPPPGARVTYNSVTVDKPYIAITFDDGPHATNTPRLLDMLKQRNIKATFYVVGQCVQEYPHLVRRILAEGHEMGNHSWKHNALSGMSLEKAREDLMKTHQAVISISGYHMRTMRPPYGATNLRVKQLCHEEFGYPTIIWSVDPLDWKRPGAQAVQDRIVSATHPGAIILVHDIHEASIDAMPGTLDTLLSKGYQFVTVSQLLNLAQAQAQPPPPPVAVTKAELVTENAPATAPAPTTTTAASAKASPGAVTSPGVEQPDIATPPSMVPVTGPGAARPSAGAGAGPAVVPAPAPVPVLVPTPSPHLPALPALPGKTAGGNRTTTGKPKPKTEAIHEAVDVLPGSSN